MSYRHRLKVWAIVRLLPQMQRVTIARYKSKSDALGHLTALQHLQPGAQYQIMFDIPPDPPAPQPQPEPPPRRYRARSLYRGGF